MNRTLCATFLLSFALMVPFAFMQGAAADPLKITVEDVPVQGNASNCRIAVDADGNAHIIYFDEDSGSLMHTTNAGGSWTTETVAGQGLAGRASSIALDSRGAVHISYVGGEQDGYGDLMYATNEGGSWSSVLIDDGYVIGHTSIVVDPSDNVHISYHTGHDELNDSLKYATNAGGSWSVESVDTGISGYYNAICVDPSGTVHIVSYAGIGGMPLKYTTNAGGAWSTQNIEDTVWIGSFCSVAVDSAGRPHAAISTSDEISQVDLKDVVFSGGSWSSEAIEFGGYVWDRSIAIDGGDVAHICYRSSAANELMYATNAGGSWSTHRIDDLGSSTSHASIAVDDSGTAYISYISSDDGERLRYAKVGSSPAPSAPVVEEVMTPPGTSIGESSERGQQGEDPGPVGLIGWAGLGAVAVIAALLVVKGRRKN